MKLLKFKGIKNNVFKIIFYCCLLSFLFCQTLNQHLLLDKNLPSIYILNFRNSSYEPFFHHLLTKKIKEEFIYKLKNSFQKESRYSLYGELVHYEEIKNPSFVNRQIICVIKWQLFDEKSNSLKIKNKELTVRYIVSNKIWRRKIFQEQLSKIVANRLYKDLMYSLNVKL